VFAVFFSTLGGIVFCLSSEKTPDKRQSQMMSRKIRFNGRSNDVQRQPCQKFHHQSPNRILFKPVENRFKTGSFGFPSPYTWLLKPLMIEYPRCFLNDKYRFRMELIKIVFVCQSSLYKKAFCFNRDNRGF
jgi:hypothetical protein